MFTEEQVAQAVERLSIDFDLYNLHRFTLWLNNNYGFVRGTTPEEYLEQELETLIAQEEDRFWGVFYSQKEFMVEYLTATGLYPKWIEDNLIIDWDKTWMFKFAYDFEQEENYFWHQG